MMTMMMMMTLMTKIMMPTCILSRVSSVSSGCLLQAGDDQCPPAHYDDHEDDHNLDYNYQDDDDDDDEIDDDDDDEDQPGSWRGGLQPECGPYQRPHIVHFYNKYNIKNQGYHQDN